MKKNITRAAFGVIAAVSAIAVAHAQVTVEDAIRHRQSAYDYIAWNMGKIKAQVVDGSVAYNQAQVQAAANAIAAIANSGMSALYVPGSDKGTGWHESKLKASFFQETDKAGAIAGSFVKEANKLQEVAAAGDKDAIKAQFGEVGKTCKACHDDYRIK